MRETSARGGPPAHLRERIDETLDHMRVAVEDEIEAVRASRQTTLRLVRGRLLHARYDRHLYRFETDVSAPSLVPETPVVLLTSKGERSRGSLVATEEFHVLVELDDNLGATVPQAELKTEPWFILRMLGERLASLRSDGAEGWRTGDILPALLDLERPKHTDTPPEELSPSLNPQQRKAVRDAASRSLHYVWGPPGTGKTSALAETVRTLLARGERVLLVAHSNVAVDIATLRAAALLEGSDLLEEDRILRVGTAQLPEMRESGLVSEAVLRRRWPDLFAEYDGLLEERRMLAAHLGSTDHETRSHAAKRLEEVRTGIGKLCKQIDALTNELVADARLLGVTLAKLIVDSGLWSQSYDAVVADEVSMASFAFLFAAASRAERRVLLFGDARQLPPVHLSDSERARHWLGRDAFAVAGLSELPDDDRVSFLYRQFRMAPGIARVVSELAYHGRLETEPIAADRAAKGAALAPAPGRELVVIDTSGLSPRSVHESKRGSYSRVNPLHAALAAGIARTLWRSGCENLAFISPYRAQAYLASRFQAELVRKDFARTATVHRFQGTESDAVILDLVDAEPQKGASRLTGSEGDLALRLLNVALSRARGKLVVLADVTFIRKRHLPGAPASRLLELVEDGSILPADEVLDSHPERVTWFENWDAAMEALSEDVKEGAPTLVGSMPEGFVPAPALVEAFAEASISKSLLYAPIEVAGPLEETDIDIRLIPFSAGFVLTLGHDLAWVGGATPAAPLVRLSSPGAARALEDVLFGTELRIPRPDATVDERLMRVYGRCKSCGNQRWPRLVDGRWALHCGARRHAAEPLSLPELGRLVEITEAVCDDCGGPAMVQVGAKGPFLACANRDSGCQGLLPRLDELF